MFMFLVELGESFPVLVLADIDRVDWHPVCLTHARPASSVSHAGRAYYSQVVTLQNCHDMTEDNRMAIV